MVPGKDHFINEAQGTNGPVKFWRSVDARLY